MINHRLINNRLNRLFEQMGIDRKNTRHSQPTESDYLKETKLAFALSSYLARIIPYGPAYLLRLMISPFV
jgi:hypothetical protein